MRLPDTAQRNRGNGGGIETGETAEDAARREAEEETGWRPVGPLTRLARFHPSSGLLDQTFSAYLATAAEHVGEPTSVGEAAEVHLYLSTPATRPQAEIPPTLVLTICRAAAWKCLHRAVFSNGVRGFSSS